MAEDHRFQSSDGRHRLCINNCGFLGSPATQNMCSKCYTDLRHKNAGGDSLIPFSHAITAASVTSSSTSSRPIFAAPVASISFSSPEKVESSVTAAHGGRCSACRKKVGLLGFRCRCGTTFCGTHRYPEKHGCTFDFKAIGRMEIAIANPVVKADKLDRI